MNTRVRQLPGSAAAPGRMRFNWITLSLAYLGPPNVIHPRHNPSALSCNVGQRLVLAVGIGFALALAVAASQGADVPTPRADPAQTLLLDAALSGSDIIAVGERATILYSTDNARTWQRSAASTRATLTAVSFASPAAPRQGWAVGHDAQILATTDAGRTWVKQHQGENLQDSFLDVVAVDAQRVIAVGAYGLYAETRDGGRNWERRRITEDDYHYNRVTRGENGTLFIAGEHGTLLRSGDHGTNWSRLKAPYDGSFYGVLALGDRTLLIYGLRGRVFRSTDDGTSWTAVPVPQPTLIASALRTREKRILLAGQARAMFESRDDGMSFVSFAEPPATAVAELLELPDGRVLHVGEAGASILSLPR